MNTSIETLLKGHIEPWRVAPSIALRSDDPPTSVLSANLYDGLKAVRLDKWQMTLPVLSCVHLYTFEGCLWLETTNLQDPLRAKVPARVNQEFSACIPWRPFIDWVQIAAHDHDLLELAWDPAVCILTVTSDNRDCYHPVATVRTRAEFKGMDAQEFPPIRDEDLTPKAAKRPTFAALCKEAAKAVKVRDALGNVFIRDGRPIWQDGFTSLERLDGLVTPILEAMRNPGRLSKDLYYWSREEFPVPALVLHHTDFEGREYPEVAVWKLGHEPVSLETDQISVTLWSDDNRSEYRYITFPTREQLNGQRFILPAVPAEDPEAEAE